ncbi:MAG TPA: GYD domain-containing protein [Capillimicrobium sp.]|nr:GYD domain-containing protein [Capillimicrobium sp.]
MPMYVTLIDWTDQGVRGAAETVDRYEAAAQRFQEMGITFRDIYWTIGAHDITAIVDAPDDATLAAALLTLAGQGNVRTTTMRAFSRDEMRDVIGRMPATTATGSAS